MLRLVPLLLAAACSSAVPVPTAPPPTVLLGQWRIVALDGHAPVVRRGGRPSALSFDEYEYGGFAGFNAFGGQVLAHERRLYGGFALSTAMACGAPFDEQETDVQRLLASGLRTDWNGPDRVAFVTSTQRLELARTGPLPSDRFVS